MMARVDSGIVAILYVVVLVAGGCLSTQQELRDTKGGPAVEKGHDHGKPGEVLDEKKSGTILMVPKEERQRE